MLRLGVIPFLFIALTACEASRQPFAGMTMPSPDGCFVQVWDGPNFSGASDFINGPRVYPSLRDVPGGRRWDNRIRSVKVGPGGTVVVWTDEKLQGMSMRLLTDSDYPRLSEALDAQVESMEIECATAGPRAADAGRAISGALAPIPCAPCRNPNSRLH